MLIFRFSTTTENKSQKFSFHFFQIRKTIDTLIIFRKRKKHFMNTSNNNFSNYHHRQWRTGLRLRPGAIKSSHIWLEGLEGLKFIGDQVISSFGSVEVKWNRGSGQVESYLVAGPSNSSHFQVKSYSNQVVLINKQNYKERITTEA